ncbi:hypothetical protein BDP27DRAFT_1335884 [Rhodocollybia butyracea]|uniref:Glycan binding protein Y3-like domain-containing protein n=1 Tax=Rhodocollybia butyracea TaxID=206335 RepID=A0A9P5PGU2_9AGAR|nr:hypothetical protein BDP27DRAFT_1335884 [Rhodocollybia butyracea]
MQSQANHHSKLGFVAAMSLLLTATPILGQTFSCFTTGVELGNCSQFIGPFCQSVNPAISIAEQNTLSGCFNVPGKGFKCDFTIWNEFATGSIPGVGAGCTDIMDLIADNCIMGGQGTLSSSGGAFQLIPNEGSCNFNG